jgi:hypothetical protein
MCHILEGMPLNKRTKIQPRSLEKKDSEHKIVTSDSCHFRQEATRLYLNQRNTENVCCFESMPLKKMPLRYVYIYIYMYIHINTIYIHICIYTYGFTYNLIQHIRALEGLRKHLTDIIHAYIDTYSIYM